MDKQLDSVSGGVRAAVVSLVKRDDDPAAVEASLDELERLLETAGAEAVIRLVQNKETPDARTYLGSGKIKELQSTCRDFGVQLVVFDTELSPSQIKNAEDELSKDNPELRVIDRSMLILDIFAIHATTSEGKLQVELAQLKYTAPRLIGKGISMSRQQGGNIAMRGPGETKLETDRRHIRRRMQALEQELKTVEEQRLTQRKQRDKSGITKVAIVGYTNAGKSTLLNRLTDAGILAEDKLFATLDPTTRKYTLPDGNEILLIDTVGFIRNLPHHLIKAFKTTLDEVVYADIIIAMTDASDREAAAQLEVTDGLLNDLGATGKPVIYVYNKCDRETDFVPCVVSLGSNENVFFISARTGKNVNALVERIMQIINERTSEVVFDLHVSEQGVLNRMYRFAKVVDVSYEGDRIKVKAICDGKAKGMFREWIDKKAAEDGNGEDE